MSNVLEEYKKTFWDNQHKKFMEMMNESMEEYRKEVKDNKDIEKAEFRLWHIIKDAYDKGFREGHRYFEVIFFELTDAEEHFRDIIRGEI